MSTLIIWLLSPLPFLFAGGVWIFNKNINWIESTILSVLGFVIALSFSVLGVLGMTHDIEIWSGQCTEARHIPSWLEYYEEAIYRTETYTETETYYDGKESKTRTVTKTREVFDHWEPRTRQHLDEYHFSDTLGNNISISVAIYNDVKTKFGGTEGKRKGDRTTSEHNSRMISGDPNDYYTINTTNHIYPVQEGRTWSNKVKAAPSVFSFPEVPPTVKVHEYPTSNSHFVSKRVINTNINTYKWDQLCAELGPFKKVNLIIINFPNNDESIAEWQRAKWIGGKKNDLVICHSSKDSSKPPTWAKVFGWTESEIAKVNLEQVLLTTAINDSVIPKIREIVIRDYRIKDWKKFDYLDVELPASLIIWYISIQILVCGGWFWISYKNGIDKSEKEIKMIKK